MTNAVGVKMEEEEGGEGDIPCSTLAISASQNKRYTPQFSEVFVGCQNWYR
jgi:hypothetical protein